MAFFSTLGAFSDEIIERFDIVGFDPRGVGLSDLLVILSDKVGGFDLTRIHRRDGVGLVKRGMNGARKRR